MTMDFLILKEVIKKGVTEEKVLLTLLDASSEFSTAVPLPKRTAKYVELAIIQHAGLRKIKYAYTDQAKELVKSCKDQKIPHETSAPYEHQANGMIETYNRIELFGCRCSFEQCGAPSCFWPWASRHVAFARNILDVNGKGSTP